MSDHQEMLDEIKRLRELVLEAHTIEDAWQSPIDGTCFRTCKCGHVSRGESPSQAFEAFLDHVAKLVEGPVKP
jgi:hypothetical protein